jgi:hypothetical protein
VSIVDLAAVLLPHLAQVQLDRVYLKGVRVRIEASTRATVACCPDCGAASQRVHNRYVRHVVDTGFGGREATVSLTVRRLTYRRSFLCASCRSDASARGATRPSDLLGRGHTQDLVARPEERSRLEHLIGVDRTTLEDLQAAIPILGPSLAAAALVATR